MDVICTLEAAKRIRELEQECITQEREKFKYIERAKTERDRALAAERQLAEAEAKLTKAAKVILDHMNDDDYEMSLAGLYAYLTAEHVLSAAGDATVDPEGK